jgi:hypothetical protein
VRSLERHIAAICRHVSVRVATFRSSEVATQAHEEANREAYTEAQREANAEQAPQQGGQGGQAHTTVIKGIKEGSKKDVPADRYSERLKEAARVDLLAGYDPVCIRGGDLQAILGMRPYESETALREGMLGVRQEGAREKGERRERGGGGRR